MLLFLSVLLIILVLFLYLYYGILDHGFRREEKKAAANAGKQSAQPVSGNSLRNDRMLNLLPVPYKIEYHEGSIKLPGKLTFQVDATLKDQVGDFLEGLPGIEPAWVSGGAFFRCVMDASIPAQGYRLILNPGYAVINYSTGQGLHYGLVTVKVLMQNYQNNIPCVTITDSPDLEIRGAMLDISRNKVPTLATLMGIAGLLADLKYNHLELYIEGFSFAYPSFKPLWEGSETPLTGNEIKQLDAFCRENYIDLVPNQNSLGHMAAWLATNEYQDLAECPDGFRLMGLIKMKTTLDPNDPRSLELVTRMTDDLLPNFTSGYYNVNLDEPFELGVGKNKKLARKKGVGQVYLDYVLNLHKMVTARDKKMMMWCDIALKHPEILTQLPGDITLLDWGYEAEYPFDRNGHKLDSAGISFLVCPGTSSWTSITGRTANMLGNIENAAISGKKHHAKGLLVTDWGDMGHWQYLPVSYAGYATAGALGWNSNTAAQMPLQKFLDSYVFHDPSGLMGGFALDMGSYNLFEEFLMFNMTTTMLTFQFGLRDRVMARGIFNKVIQGLTTLMKDIAPDMIDTVKTRIKMRKDYDHAGLMQFLDKQEGLLKNIRLGMADSLLVKDEYSNAITLIRLGAGIKQYITSRNSLTTDQELNLLVAMDSLCSTYLKENSRLWLLRNKPGGLDASTASLVTLKLQIAQRTGILQESSFRRNWHRFTEKLASAALVIYLKLV